MKVEIEIPYRPFPAQAKFHDSVARFRAIISGVGFGKSAAGVNEMIMDITEHSDTLSLIFAPTYPMLINTTMREFWKFCPQEIVADHNRGRHMIEFKNGAKIVYLSGDNERDIDRLRGLTLGSAYGDEISLCPYYMWEVIMARIRDPAGSGRVWVTTTPKGYTWLFSLFHENTNPRTGDPLPNPQDFAIFGGRMRDNPHTTEEYKQQLENLYVGVFRKQELYGEFVGFEGLVYPEFSPSVHVISKPPKMVKYVGGVDWGYTNPSVLLVVGIDGDGRVYVLEEFYERRVLVESLIKRAQEYRKKYKIETWHADPSRPEHIAEFNNHGLLCYGESVDVLPRINEVATYLPVQKDDKPRLFVHQRCVNTINEFKQYRFPDTKEGKPEQDNPIKIHDHALDAIGYTIWGIGAGITEFIDTLDTRKFL